ncbi:MAG TPA: serine/threonine-protein kinase [Bryobacteraceae bacterium]|jgi:serine/threonine protein kinase|nr:serine/threonine-protein kinase [Bryobacteraceae bacterium]
MSQIGRYEVVRQTGNHGLGSLYQAFDPVMHRPVMIRIADRNTDPGVSFDQARQAILFDAKQLAHLDHPNIIKFLACEEDDGRPYLVMERFEGKPLSGVFSQQRLSSILNKAALALDHAHSKGLIHRNLTPENLLLDDEGELKITGFEIARPAQYLNSEAGQDLDLLLDSIHYMSPEVVKGDVLDARSDQYSLGVIVWQALTGALPFRSDSPITLLANIAFEPPELRGASSAIIPVFERVLSKSPVDRFASASEFASAFQSAISEPVVTRKEPKPVPIPSRLIPPEEKKSLLPWIIAAVVIVALVVAGAILITRPSPKVAPPQPAAAPQIVPAPPPAVRAPPPAVKAKPRAAKKAPVKETTPEAPKLKPIDPKVVHQ